MNIKEKYEEILVGYVGIHDREEVIEELLNLHSVSHQRELLIAFAKYMEEDKMYERHDEANVDDFLDNHSD